MSRNEFEAETDFSSELFEPDLAHTSVGIWKLKYFDQCHRIYIRTREVLQQSSQLLHIDKYLTATVHKRLTAARRFFIFRAHLSLKAKSVLLLAFCYPFQASASEAPLAKPTLSPNLRPVAVKAGGTENIEVHPKLSYGQGLLNVSMSKDVERSEIQRPWIKMQTPTANVFDLISLVPGANVSSADTAGLSAQDSLYVRGLDGTEIGYILEGMPMNDLADNSGTPAQFSDTENLEKVSLQQGSTNIGDPLLTGAGGVVSMSFRAPKKKFGTEISATFGNHNEYRQFIRMDTGYIGNTGIRGFASFSNTLANNWHGPGDNDRKHVDFKFTKDFGSRVTASILGSYNRALTGYYQAQANTIDRYGHGNGLSPKFGPDQYGRSEYWKLWGDREQTIYLGLPINVRLNKHFSFDVLGYGHRAFGNWPWGNNGFAPESPYYGRGATTDVLRADSTQTTSRGGIILTLHANYKHHKLSVGWWGDMGYDIQKSPLMPVDQNGHSPDPWGLGHGHITDASGNVIMTKGFATRTYVNSIFFGDEMQYGKNHISIGFKEVWMEVRGRNKLHGLQGHVNHNYSIPLPRFSYSRQVTKNDNFFIHVSTNFRTPNFASYYYGKDPDSGITTNFMAESLKPEYSVEEQIGWNHQGKYLGFSATFFNYNFMHRQFKTVIGYGNGRYYGTYRNAGSQSSRGVDLELALKKTYGFSPYFSFEYIDATVDSNLPYGNMINTNTPQISYAHTKGKRPVNTPSIMLGAGLTYEHNGFYAFFSAHYTGSQYGTYLNNSKVPGYVTENIGFGYKGKDIGFLHTPSIKFNMVNVSDRRYFSSTLFPQVGNNMSDPNQEPYYVLGGGSTVTGTIQAGF